MGCTRLSYKMQNKQQKASEMTKWINTLAIKPGDLSSSNRTHMVEGKFCPLTSTHMPYIRQMEK
jgi:mRNA-degrading endonuclease YafQ of YafQ-DinJ toxin-antitoxin module